MARITRISSERVHGWFRLLTETLGRRKHFAVSFLNASHETTRTTMEEVVILDDDPPAPSTSVALSDAQGVAGSKHLPPGQTPYTISITVVRGNQGFGFSVAWTKPPRVERVEEGLPADQAGLKPGDYIIFVSHYNVVKFDEDSVLDIIRECGDTLPLEVYRRGVSKHPRGLPNGYTGRTTLTENESHPRKRLSHISFNTESASADRQTIIFALINCEQAFSHACRFGLERYLIPLKFRSDLITQSQHRALFNNMDQLMDLSENLVDRLMGSDEDTIGDHVGGVYYQLIEELAEHYDNYLGGLPEADKVLSLKLLDMDFKDFLLVPTVPRKKPDITTFIHKPAEHLREVLGLLTQVYTSSPGHPDNTYLDTVLHRLKSCYRGMTSQQNIMEPSPPAHLPTGLFGMTPSPSSIRSSTPLRPPLVSVSDIEQRLVFTKFTQPFRLNDTWRQWVFGGELYKFEGRHLKQYWAMLFTDLLLFTKINRDRVIFVMEDPVPLTGVCQALFNIKKKATEFRLIVDTRVRVSGAGSGYLTTSKSQRMANKNSVSGRSHKKTMVLRAPTIDLKATWNNLIHRQLYICQQQQQQQQLAGSPRHHAPSLARAVSSDGLHSLPLARGRFSSSVGDLRRGGRQEEEIVLDLGDDRTRGSTTSLFRSSKVRLRSSGECEEEIDLNLENEPVQPPPSAPATSAAPVATASRVSHRRPVAAPPPPAELQPGEVHLVIQDEDPARSSSRRFRSSRPSKVRRGGGKAVEEIVLNLDDDEVQTAPVPQNTRSSRVNSALVNGSQEPPADVALDQNVENAAKDSTDNGYDEEVEDDIVIQDEKTGIQTRIDSKKGKGIGGKVKDKLFPNRHLPKKKKMNRVKKVEKFVDSIVVEDLNHHGRVTPVFVDEEDLTPDDFAQKRKHILQNRPRNYIEGEEEIITLDVSSPSTSHLSPMRAELMMAEERRKLAQKKKEEKRIAMRLEGIEEESLERSSSLGHEEPRKTVLSPEDYEDYIGDAVEKDYPELAGGSEAPPPQRSDSQEREELPSEEPQQFEQEQLIENQKQLIEEQKHVIEMQKQLIEEKEQQDQVQQPQPTGPLSGSASMNFMDDHSPTSNGNGDYFHRCVAKYPRDPPRQACGSFSVEANYLLTSEVDIRNETCRSIPETSLLNNNESINSFSTHFRTSCVASNDCVSGNSRKPKRTTSVSSSTSASVTESRNNSTSASEHSSMSISTGSVSSNLSNANKNRSSLFLPTSTTSLPEISIEPPTPQAPKPKDSFDRENKIMYDLRVPGYRSMFLTVPGFDDDDCDRYLPKYDLDSDDEEHSSDDDDVVHKPRVFASLAGTAESRGLKRYGSSCDIAKLVNSTAEPIYPHDDDPNGNFEFNVRKSKIGGTGSGPFVARKLEMFEKVVEEEHQKFIECQEVRKRIFRAPKKSGEYIEKFYSPQVIETIDVRATEKSRSLRYYDDEYDSFDNPRSPTPTELKTPYGGHSSPQMATSNYSSRPSCSSLYSGTIYDPPRSPSPARDYPATSYADDVFDTYDFVRGHPRSPSPPPTDSRKGVRVCSPIPEMTVDSEVIYSQPSMFRDAECSETMISGPSRSPPPNTRDNLEQRTDEVLEMLDNSFLDTLPEDDGPNHYAAMSKRHDENAEEGAVAGYNVGNSVYDTKEEPTRVASPLPDLRVTPDPDPLDDVFEIEDYDSQGSTTSLRGGHRRRAAPPPPPPPEEAGPSSSSDKRGGFFGRVRRERDKDKDKEKKDKEKKDKEKEKKEKKEKEKERKEREKKEKENKDKDKDKAAGKRFQLFGGAKKASEPNAAEETSTKPPKKDKGKRRLFGRGKENFIGCSAHISHESDPQESTYVSGEIVDESEEDTISFSDEDAQKYFEEILYPGGRRRKSDPPAIFVFTPEETEVVMALDSRHRSRRASEVYNVASEEDPVEDTVLNFTERYRNDINLDAVENNNNCWTTVEEVAMNMERDLRNRSPEESKAPVKKTSPRRSSPFSPRKSAPKTLANAAIESPRKSPKKSPKNTPKKSPKNSPSAPKKLLPEILESSVQTYRPVYHVNLDNSNLVPVPYTPRYSENSTTATFRVPVAAPRSFLTKKVTTPVEEKTRKEEEWSKPKESKDTRGRIKKTQKNAQKYEEKTSDVKQSPRSHSNMNIKDCLNPEKNIVEHQDEEQQVNNNSVVIEVQKPSRPNSLILRDTFQDEGGITAYNMAATRVTSFTSPDDSSDSQEVVVQRRRLSLELDPDESLALSTLEAVVTEGPKSSTLYSCSNQPFNSFQELEAMKDKHPVRAHDADTKTSGEIVSSEGKLSDGTHHTEDTDDLDCVVNLPSLDDSLTDDRHDSLPSDQEGGERCNTSSMMSDYTLSRDSLEGFLNDDIKSLRSFVAQRNLDMADLPEEPKRKEEKVKDSGGLNSEEREDSIDFTFEEVDDSPSHFVKDRTTEEKRTSKRSPKLGRFSQKVSDKNKENEEKSKIGSFRPRNILLFGSKDKNKMKGNKPNPTDNDATKTESWTSETIEEYLLNNNREETLRLGLLNEEDVAVHEAKMDGSWDVTDNRKAAAPPEVLVNDEARPTTPGPSSRKRQAPIPPQRKSPNWKPQDIENYLLEHNMNENLRLGLLSQEDIQIYEWKRATVASELQVRRDGDSHPPPSGMSPICDTSWTRETLRKNKVVRGSSSSSLSSSVTPSPETQRPSMSSPTMGEERKRPSERAIDVPSSPQVKPARRRARAPPPPPLPSVIRTFPATTSTPTSARKVSGHFAFRGFKLGQRVGKGVGDGISRLGQAVGDRVHGGASSHAKPSSSSSEVKPEVTKSEVAKTEVTKTEVSRPKKLVLERIGVKLPGLASRDTSPAAAEASESSGSAAGTPVTDEAAPVGEAIPGAQQRRRETPYRKLARLLGKEPPAKAPAPPAVVPSHALFLREAPRATAASIQDDEESGIRKKLSDMRLRLGWLRRRGEGQVSVRPQPEEAQGWAESFHNLMASKYGQALFKAFLQREFSEENVEFWLAVEDFKKTRAAKMPSKASKIHSDYVAVQAPKEINLDPGTRAQIAKSLDCPDKYIFDAAQKRVQALMESDAYLRFLQSELYKELLHPESSSPSNPDAL